MDDSWVYVGDPSGPDGKGGSAQVMAVHAALMPNPTGGTSILYFGGDEWAEPKDWEAIQNEPNPFADPRFPAAIAEIDHSRLFDTSTHQITNALTPVLDLFCSGHAFAADGKLVVVGGTQHWPPPEESGTFHSEHFGHWSGSRDTWIYDSLATCRGKPGTAVSAVWSTFVNGHLDLFMTDGAGAVWSSWWEEPVGWQVWTRLSNPSVAAPGGTVTALWATNKVGHLDLFVTDSAGTVTSTWWEPGLGWQSWTGISPKNQASPGAEVTALWAANKEGHLDLFVTGPDGTVWTSWWELSTGWTSWNPISPQQKAKPGATVTAWWETNHTNLDLLMVDITGTVWITYWDLQSGWRSWVSISSPNTAAPGATVTAVIAPYNSQHVDLFVTGPDGSVLSTWRETAYWQSWVSLSSNYKIAPGATVTALWQPFNEWHLDLFASDPNGAVSTVFWEKETGWRDWFTVSAAQHANPGAPITAVWAKNKPGHLDLFMTSSDGTRWTTWWEESVNWQEWFSFIAAYPWIRGPLLNHDTTGSGGGRWYPTVITLASGSILAHCGHPLIGEFGTSSTDDDDRHNNAKPEVLDTNFTAWRLITKPLGVEGSHDYAPFYPRMHVVPHSGEVLLVQPLYSNMVTPGASDDTQLPGYDLESANPLDSSPPYQVDVKDKSLFYNVDTMQVIRSFPGPQLVDRYYLERYFSSQPTTSVMLPLLYEEGYHPRVLLCGAVTPIIADLTATSPSWTPTAPRKLIDTDNNTIPLRVFNSATLLPTAKVVVTGGVTAGFTFLSPDKGAPDFPLFYGNDYTVADGVRNAEVYTPPFLGQPDSWSFGKAQAGETRGYHSVALLMPDGRIWTAGGEYTQASGTPNYALELYQPDYISVEGRLEIVAPAPPSSVKYASTFKIGYRYPIAGLGEQFVVRVAFMRFGSATHGCDGDQRYVGVPFVDSPKGTLTVTAPPDATVAPPGYYMLWLIGVGNLPCQQAAIIRLGV